MYFYTVLYILFILFYFIIYFVYIFLCIKATAVRACLSPWCVLFSDYVFYIALLYLCY